MLKKNANKFWVDGNESQLQIADGEEIRFLLKYRKMTIGKLSFNDNCWKFEYADEFILQKNISPLVNFPQKDKVYQSEVLWPFFASRIPSNAQLMLAKDEENTDLVKLLKEYGRRTVINPYELNAV